MAKKKDNIVKLVHPKVVIDTLAKENIDLILDKNNKIEAAIIAFRHEDEITIFTTKYSAELVGLLELTKVRIIDGMLTYDPEDED